MNNTNKIIISLVALGIIFAAYYFYAPQRQIVPTVGTSENNSVQRQVSELLSIPLTQAQREEPLTVSGPEKLKIFNIKITQNAMSPDNIVVEKGDLVQFDVHSDKDVRLESRDLQFSASIKKDSLYSVSVPVAKAGEYVFYEQDGVKTVFGKIIVRPRE